MRGQSSPVVSLWRGFAVAGRYVGCCARDTMPPSPKGQQPASRRTGHSVPTSWGAHAERSPRPLVLSPFGFCGSRRQWVVNPRTRVSGALAVEDNQPSRQLALLEPETTAGQPASVSTKAPSSPRPLQSNQLPCLQKLLEPETAAGQPAPASAKAAQKLEHLGTTSPTVNQPSPFSKVKN